MSDHTVALVLALAVSAVLLGMRPPVTQGVDYQLGHQFYKFYLRESVRSGEWPLWNPYVSLGRPFLADIEASVFYPPNWIFIALPEIPALFLFLTFHFWLAGFFFIKLARHWAAPREAAITLSFAYLMSGPLLGHLQGGLLDYFCGLAYWPLLFYFTERLREKISLRHWLMLVLAATGSFLSGHLQCFWLSAVAFGFYLLGSHLGRPWGRNILCGLQCIGALAGAYVFTLIICAAQLLPLLDLALQGNRTAPSLSFSASGAIDWGTLTSLFVSQPNRSTLTWWDSNLHVGVICTLLGALGLMQWREARVRGLWLMGGMGSMLALGGHTPLFAAMFHLLPGMSAFRMASRYAAFLSWAFLLAGVIAWAKGKFSLGKTLLALAILVAGTMYVVWTSDRFWHSALASAALLVGLTLLTLWTAHRDRGGILAKSRLIWLVLIWAGSVAAAAHMWAYYQHYGGKTHEAEVASLLHKRNLYPPNGVPPRLFLPPYLVKANSGMKYGFSSVAGNLALTSMRVWTYLHIGTGLPVGFFQNTYLPLNAYQAGPFPFPGMNIIVGARKGDRNLSTNPQPGERAYLVYAWEQVPDWFTAIQRMVRDHVDPTKIALLEAPSAGPPSVPANPGHGHAVIESFHLNSIALSVESSAPALLVVAEAWYPGWRATVNGLPVEVLPANVWMRAVRVPAGVSQVELHYVEPSLALGGTISLLALAVLAWIASRARESQA
ncbi:MAG TPA: hypothetical protein VK717_08715 [Opitutaceae bacterium]|jgi:hypothetical protein|nr:hypothetical protein [Opitutaceae bacterium]